MENNIFQLVEKNTYGFFELTHKPSAEELEKYYQNKYFQESKGAYQKKYSEADILFFHNKLEQKYLILKDVLNNTSLQSGNFLDIGCGEGWALDYFNKKGWFTIGLDFSTFGCEAHNPDCLKYVYSGNIYENIPKLEKEEKRFDVIFLGHVLEHVLDPLLLLESCKRLMSNDGVLVVEVPNDFSVLQEYLYKNNHITHPFWVVSPDHISYFNREGILALSRSAGLVSEYTMADFPIDINLLNENSNYVVDKSKGKACHKARIEMENLLHEISPERTNFLYKIFADLGLGRNIICFFRKEK